MTITINHGQYNMHNILEVFEYNQHFVSMMNIINAARLNPPTKGHKHHIIPKCWFKMKNLDVDNSDDNLVLLTVDDHQKVHRLSAMCIIGSDMRSAMGYAVHTLHGSFIGMHHTEETKRKMSESHKGKSHTVDTRKKLSEANKGKTSPRKGMKASEETRKKISESRKGITLSDDTRRKISESKKGQVPGTKGKKMTEEQRRKSSESHKKYWERKRASIA